MNNNKYIFPSRGFHIVATKVGEADYFLDKLKSSGGFSDEFAYLLSAFASATRSITFSLQAVMCKYPDFEKWYEPYQEKLRNNELAKYFMELRNHLQKVGSVPISHAGTMQNGEVKHYSFFIDIKELKNTPIGEIRSLATEYFLTILNLTGQCYRDFSIYTDPRALFTPEGLASLNWTIEDIEEAVGLPRGYTDVEWDGDDKDCQRLKQLQKEFQGDELMEQYFEKYNIFKSC